MTHPGHDTDRAEPAGPTDDTADALLDQAQTALDNQREHYGETKDNERDVVGEARDSGGRPVRNDT